MHPASGPESDPGSESVSDPASEAERDPESDENARELIATVNQVMPFGRYKGRRLIELPEPYLVWFHNEGFPNGVLGRRMAVMYEVKVNGLEVLLAPLVGAEPR